MRRCKTIIFRRCLRCTIEKTRLFTWYRLYYIQCGGRARINAPSSPNISRISFAQLNQLVYRRQGGYLEKQFFSLIIFRRMNLGYCLQCREINVIKKELTLVEALPLRGIRSVRPTFPSNYRYVVSLLRGIIRRN